MELTQLADLGEFVGGLAVLVTLVYLSIQVSQTKRAAQQTAFNSDARILQNIGLAVTTDPRLSRVSNLGVHDPSALDEDEANQFFHLVTEMMYGYEGVLRSFERGLIDADQWDNAIDNMLWFLTAPKVQEIARQRPSALAKRVVASIERRALHFAEGAE